MTNILVTGATGFIGAHLAKRLIEEGHNVVTIVHDVHSKKKRTLDCLGIRDTINQAFGSITDLNLVRRVTSDYEAKIIYHLAALPIVRVGNVSPVPIWEVNVTGTWNVMEAAKECGASVFFLSTDKVYGHHGSEPYQEDFALNGLNVYECSKACADSIVRSYHYVYGVKTAVARCCNVYGPADTNSRLIPNSIRRCLKNESPIVYEGINYIREWIYVEDAVDAFLTITKNFEKTQGQVYNVGSGYSASQEEIITKILKYFPGISYTVVPPQPYMRKEIPYQILCTDKIRKELDWSVKTNLDTGLAKTIEWWRNHSEATLASELQANLYAKPVA